jgi:hypothetical protein
MLLVIRALNMSHEWAGWRKDPFKLKTRHHILPASQAQFPSDPRVIGLEAGSEDDGTCMDCYLFFLVLEIDGALKALLFADSAFLAQAEEPAMFLVYDIFKGHRLRILDIDGLARTQSLVVLIGNFCRALSRAIAAGDALFHIDKAGAFGDRDSEIALTAGD